MSLVRPADDASSSVIADQTNKDLKLSLDTPRHSERSSSMDADGTESGSDSERMTSLMSPQSSTEATKTSSFSSGGEEASKYAEPSTGELGTNNAPPATNGHRPQRENMDGSLPAPPRARRALFPSQLPPDEDQKLPIRPNSEECLFYIHTGWCGYGQSCRYNHPPEKMAMHKPKSYNSMGLPLREGVQDCQYFLRMATCKFGSTCKFNHPQQVIELAIKMQQGQQQPPQQQTIPMGQSQSVTMQQPNLYLPHPNMAYQQQPGIATGIPGSPAHISPRRNRNSSGSISANASPTFGPTGSTMMAPSFAMPPSAAGPTSPTNYGQPIFVYYVPQPSPDQPQLCWTQMQTGRCQMGQNCPFMHQ